VRNSDVLAIVQSAEVLQRPWCLLEMVAAIDAGVPMVAVAVTGKGYDFAEATNLLLHLDTILDMVNPGACDLLRQNGVEPLDAAFKLSATVPQIISVPFNSSASSSMIQASLSDIVAAMNVAKPTVAPTDRAAWLSSRGQPQQQQPAATTTVAADDAKDVAAAHVTREHGQASVATLEPAEAPLPPTVPDEPEFMAQRPEMLAELRGLLLDGGAVGSAGTVALSSVKRSKVSTHGQGGVGKTTMASAVVRDPAVRAAFDRIGWVSVGQAPAVRELQRALFNQLMGTLMPIEDGATEDSQLVVLQAACLGKRWLVVLDDVWNKAHEKRLSCVDSASASKLFVTTRIRYVSVAPSRSRSLSLATIAMQHMPER
jgi:hypothetical protein